MEPDASPGAQPTPHPGANRLAPMLYLVDGGAVTTREPSPIVEHVNVVGLLPAAGLAGMICAMLQTHAPPTLVGLAMTLAAGAIWAAVMLLYRHGETAVTQSFRGRNFAAGAVAMLAAFLALAGSSTLDAAVANGSIITLLIELGTAGAWLAMLVAPRR